jgi:sigma-E factor negative regulatory protein RseB|tara:strand:- start:570 stop:1547 length:978 start_codon:yes stop_codon:yes gene_type:complete
MIVPSFFKTTVKAIMQAALVAAVLLSGPLFAGQMESAQDLMARMAKASRELNYSGVFTYEHRGNLTSVKLIHEVREGNIYERLLHMDGSQRDVLSRSDKVDCLRTGDMLLRGNAYKINDDNYARLEDFYEFHIKGDSRIANREVSMVHVLPKDKFRYGYVLAIDKDSGLLLQSVLMNHAGKPLERFQFVDISIGEFSAELDSQIEAGQFGSVDQTDCVEKNRKVDTPQSMWQVDWLPPGFVLASYQSPSADGQESMMYTDGLAVFSVFIDSVQGTVLPPIDAKLGATVAVLTKADINGHQYAICVVGEVPRGTASQVASAIGLAH